MLFLLGKSRFASSIPIQTISATATLSPQTIILATSAINSSPTNIPQPTSALLLTTTFEVQANSKWKNTGVVVRPGQTLEITAKGTWSQGLGDPVCPNPYGPNGINKLDREALLPFVSIGALIGRIGDSLRSLLVNVLQ